ncbi:hypothetical protein ABW20_dc0109502 [Dactylellina cionopaga]|nr:hypothetical protein ABW20_dc0109502 [Dactylellina cionopaga]
MEFSISQIDLDSRSAAQYVKIEAPVPPLDASDERPKSKKLSDGAIAGIVIGVVLAIALILGAFFWHSRRKRKVERLDPLTRPFE